MTGSKRLYLDTAPVIYYLENNDDYFAALTKFFAAHDDYIFVTSVVTLAEYLTGAMRLGDDEAVELFDEFINEYNIELVDIDRFISSTAARIRSRFSSFEMRDAMQLAVAEITDCEVFLSNDHLLKQFDNIDCVMVDEIA